MREAGGQRTMAMDGFSFAASGSTEDTSLARFVSLRYARFVPRARRLRRCGDCTARLTVCPRPEALLSHPLQGVSG